MRKWPRNFVTPMSASEGSARMFGRAPREHCQAWPAFCVPKLYPAFMAICHWLMAIAQLLFIEPMPQCTCLT